LPLPFLTVERIALSLVEIAEAAVANWTELVGLPAAVAALARVEEIKEFI
jgi:hypothetical protein